MKKKAKKDSAPKKAPGSKTASDPAHMPGHRKMNIKEKFETPTGSKNQAQNASALNNMSRADRVKRTSSTNRRIITGAAVGKTGQVVIK